MKVRDNLKDLDIDGRIILKYILTVIDVGMWTGFICSGHGSVAGYCEHGNAFVGFVRDGSFLTG
jgi:hypothetical protein